MDRFYQLPPELRAAVVECLVDHWRYGEEPESIAAYASVCREWQAIIERFNFALLRVTQNNLAEFEACMVPSRPGVLRQINLHVDLPTYDNDPCEKKETWEDKAENNRCFTRAFLGLFRIMSCWTPEETYPGGIDLVLSISSPSDLRNANFDLWQRRRWNIKDIGEKRFADSWIDFVGQDEEFDRVNCLPAVSVIRSFTVSPQNHRALMPAAHADIISRLPGLQTARFDITKDRRKETRRIHFNQFARSMNAWPASLQSLTVASNTISSWRQIPHETLAEGDSGLALAANLRAAARQLTHLSITNVMRIREFLRPFWPLGINDDQEPFLAHLAYKPEFLHLETLHISYGSIWYNTEWHKQSENINESSELIDFRQNVSLAAARMAYTMPKLRHMTIKQRPLMWAGKHELEYKVVKGQAKVTWTSTFDFRPWERTVEAWTAVANRYGEVRLDHGVVRAEWHTDGKAPHLPSLTF
ncbi:hypothetical protein CCHL11_05564 [Colletotrichum chlorophyti]|uniref:DUF6546 domain-containing protein n=1 Tax=Colletotrichum chlorophyti TaxID=708187 RepID=A0A1Q8RBD5_9PEZI|nr:hypothetical protein CCHL11_05564 [Colletotrichum chlorophyti]